MSALRPVKSGVRIGGFSFLKRQDFRLLNDAAININRLSDSLAFLPLSTTGHDGWNMNNKRSGN